MEMEKHDFRDNCLDVPPNSQNFVSIAISIEKLESRRYCPDASPNSQNLIQITSCKWLVSAYDFYS